MIHECFDPKNDTEGIYVFEYSCSCCNKYNLSEKEQEELLQQLLDWLKEKGCDSKWIVNVFIDSVRFIPVCEMKHSIFNKHMARISIDLCLKFFK